MEENTQKEKNEQPTQEPESPTIDMSGVDPKAVKMAEKFGVPVGAIIRWAQFQEARVARIEEYLQKTLPAEMKTAFQEALKSTASSIQPQSPTTGAPPQAAGNLLSMLSQFAPMVMGGSGSNDELNALAMTALKSQIKMSDAISQAVISKIMGKATSEVAEAVTTNI